MRKPNLLRFAIPLTGLLAATTCLLSPSMVRAQETHTNHVDTFSRRVMSQSSARFISGTGNIAFLAAGTLYPLLQHGTGDVRGQNRSLRTLDTAVTAAALCQGLKLLVRSERPDGSTRDSFPSGHATAAFAVAAMAARYDKNTAPLWYTGATLIAISRLRLNRHRWSDIGVGAALGIGIAEIETKQRRGLLLAPIIGSAIQRNEDAGQITRGVALSMTF